MTWFKVDDKFHDHRKSRRAQKAAIGVWTMAGSWAADNLTDGFVPESVLSRWGNRKDAARLCEANLWTCAEVEGEKGWQFVNWADFQPTKAEVEAEREMTKERVKKWREARRGNAVGNAVTPNVTNADVTPDVQVPRPDPSRPVPSKTARKRSMPEDFVPTQAHVDLAESLGVNLRNEWPQFKDYHHSRGNTMKDWDAALRTWIRNANKFGRGSGQAAQLRLAVNGQPVLNTADDLR